MASKYNDRLLEDFLMLFAKLVLLHTAHALIGEHIVFLLIAPKTSTMTQGMKAMHHGSPGDGLKVIACGFSRSGTLSLKLALDYIGFPCYHGACLFNPTHPRLWLKAARKSFRRNDLERILLGYTAIADFPAACFYKEMMVAFPHAKVILNTRDPEEWYESCLRTLWRLQNSILLRMFRPGFWTLAGVAFYAGKFEGRFEEKEFAIGVYERHTEEVKRHVPKEKLLVYQNKDGWGPLCDFLKVRIPDVPFPRSNDTKSMERKIDRMLRVLSVLLAVYLALISCIVALLFKYLLS